MSLDLDLNYLENNFKVDKSRNHRVYRFEEFRLEAAHLMLSRGGKEIPLVPKAVETLLVLIEQRGNILSKDELMAAIWTDSIVEESNLAQYLHILRKTLGNQQNGQPFIETLRRRGYRFNGDVELSRSISTRGTPRPLTLEKSENVYPIAQWRRSDVARENRKPDSPRADIGGKQSFLFAAVAAVGVALVVGLGYYSFKGLPKTPEAPIASLAVLPFRPLIKENRDEALELGMTDTLISRLGNDPEIVVRPLSSVRNFGNLEQDAIDAGRSLDVASVLEGSIQRWGDKIRVNVRLIKVVDGTVLWTETFDEKFNDIFVVQDAISSRVATALALRLTDDEKLLVDKRFTNSAEAYAFYLRGRHHFFKITEPEIRKGIGFYEKAIQVDPNYALAYAGMADAYRTLASAGFARSKDVCPQAKALAQRALAIDDSLAEAHIVLGWIGFLYDWDWAAGEKELKRAIKLSPNNSEAHRAYAHLLSTSGRHDEAIAAGRRARELAPLTLITSALEGQFLFYAGRDAEAIERLKQTLELDPDFWVAHNVLGRVYLSQERFAEAIIELLKAKELSSRSAEPLTQLGYAFAKSGDRERAKAVLRELESRSLDKNVPGDYALVYNGLGETERALEMLEKSRENRGIQLAFLKVDTRWDNLRSEPRFIELMNQLNFGK